MTDFIKGAIKHPGIEKRKAAANGISTHEQLERDAKSSDPHVRGRGELGLRFERGGDLHHGDGHTTSGMDRAMQSHADKIHPRK